MASSFGAFFFITDEVIFEEANEKGARISATFMELDTPSQNGRIYRAEEGESIAESLIGKPIKFGANWLGKHLKSVPQIGIVESAYRLGKKVKGVVRIWEKSIIEELKKGTKFLFSVGGVAQFAEVVEKGKQKFTRLWNAICTHLQLLPNDPEGAGFPTAKMHEVIEINESVILVEEKEATICDGHTCRILTAIKEDFEEAKKKALKDEIKRKAINRAIAQDIAVEVKEPWLSVETES